MSGSVCDDAVIRKLKQTITTKLSETRDHVERELPEYIMSMITNKKPKSYMIRNLEAFMGDDTVTLCDWIFDLVEKINGSVPEDCDVRSADYGSGPANSIKNIKDEREKDAREKQSSSRSKDESSRKRKGDEIPIRSHVPIEYPEDSHRRRDSHRTSSRRDKDRDREGGRNKDRERDRHESNRRRSPRRRSKEKTNTRDSESSKWESDSRREKITFNVESSDDEPFEQARVASKVVIERRAETVPTVSSKVTVKRNARQMGDEKLMRARSKMFVNALHAASSSTAEEPTSKMRIIEKTVSTGTGRSIEDRIVRVRLDVSKPPTKRMEEQLKKKQEARVKTDEKKRKHEEIIYDLEENMVDMEDNEASIDKVIKEALEQEEVDKELEEEEPPTKKKTTKPVMSEQESIEGKKKTRCTFWPKCSRGDGCHYLHPNQICAVFPKCSYGASCHYVHPPCKFGTECKNKKCSYTHGDAEVLKMLANYFPTTSTSSAPKYEPLTYPPAPIVAFCGVTCRYMAKCKNPFCQYDHPQVCKFRENCINERCTYFHPPPPHPSQLKKNIPPKNRYRWSAGMKC